MYETSDSALAAYLITQGTNEPQITLDKDKQCVFGFNEIDNLQVLVNSYQSGNAHGNIYLFFHNYKRLLKRVHNSKIS